jgi:hypothetical protein
MRVDLKFVIGSTLLLLGFLFCLAGVLLFGLSQVFPLAFPSSFKVVAAFVIAISVPTAIIGDLMGDIIGINLRDLVTSRRKRALLEADYFPFQLITDPREVLPSLLAGPGLIPDYKLPYQRRKADQNTIEELRNLLFKYRKVLIAGVGGIGKTREAGKLLADLLDEGFTLLRAKSDARFDSGVKFPESLHHSIVFLFDDMHQRCADPATLIDNKLNTESFLDSLSNFFRRVENRYTTSEIYMLFISRSDTEAWDYIQFPSHPIWQNVILYKLPHPDIESQKNFILGVANRLELTVDPQEALKLAEANDGTFRNLIQNIYRAKLANKTTLRLDDSFTTKQGKTWSNRYELLCQKHPKEMPILFDVFNILSDINLPLHKELVIYLAASLMPRSIRSFAKRRLLHVVSQLQADGDLILDDPSQEYVVHELMLSVKQTDIATYKKLLPLIWRYATRLTDYPLDTWLNLSEYCINEGIHLKLGIQIVTHIMRTNPNHIAARNLRAKALTMIGSLDFALDDQNVACELEPQNAGLLNDRGIIYLNLEKFEQAEADFNKAILIDPTTNFALANRASVLMIKGNYKFAESDLEKAINLQPDFAPFYVERARARWELGKYDLVTKNK